MITMHPLKEKMCDDLLDNPLLATPDSLNKKPQRSTGLRLQKPREFKLPERFPLLDIEFYNAWCAHRRDVFQARPKVDAKPAKLYPELYLKPRRLNEYAKRLEDNIAVNKELLRKINIIQRFGGIVECWDKNEQLKTHNRLQFEYKHRSRKKYFKALFGKNVTIYSRLLKARSKQPLTCELNEWWTATKEKLIRTAALPFILFKTEKLDRGIKDPAMDKPYPAFYRPRVFMTLWVPGGSKIGQMVIELFVDIAPETCNFFLSLVKGDKNGHAYLGTRLFRIVPELYCTGGDVTKDNGFGCYLPEGLVMPMEAENYTLKHTIPGTLSMVVTDSNEVCGQFNIIFKPLPQFDNKNVVFGRIIAGHALLLERISALGLPQGRPTQDVQITTCGWYSKSGAAIEGAPNTIKFPPRSGCKAKK